MCIERKGNKIERVNKWWVFTMEFMLFVILFIMSDEHQRKWNWFFGEMLCGMKSKQNKIYEDEYECWFNNFRHIQNFCGSMWLIAVMVKWWDDK